jgi:hypothetical protein
MKTLTLALAFPFDLVIPIINVHALPLACIGSLAAFTLTFALSFDLSQTLALPPG